MPPKRSPSPRTPAFHVDLLVQDDVMLGSVLTVLDLLRSANTIAHVRHGESRAPVFGWRLLGPDAQRWNGWDELPASYACAEPRGEPPATRRAVFVPHVHARNIPHLREQVARLPAWAELIGQALQAGAWVLALGNAVWFAARSGGLAGRRIALPWMYIAGFRDDFRDDPGGIEIASGESCVQDGPMLSATHAEGLSEIVLRLIGHAGGQALQQSCATTFRFEPERQEVTAQAVRHRRIPATRDSTLARAIDWMQAHLERPYRLEDLATAAAVSPRTLLRHFQQVLGHSPLDHLHHLRCKRACVLLEITLDGVPAIAEACGYADPAAFRRVFLRHVKVTPSQYRERYALRSARARWKVEDRSAL